MPNIKGKKFPYTKKGKESAKDYAKKIREAGEEMGVMKSKKGKDSLKKAMPGKKY